VLLCPDTDLFSAVRLRVLPEQQVADREAPIHRVEQVANLGVPPDERALDVGQTDVADVQVVQQTGEVVVDALEAGFQFAHPIISSMTRSASFNRRSPEMSFGSSESRAGERRACSALFFWA
jgi:hypothetical protein